MFAVPRRGNLGQNGSEVGRTLVLIVKQCGNLQLAWCRNREIAASPVATRNDGVWKWLVSCRLDKRFLTSAWPASAASAVAIPANVRNASLCGPTSQS